MLEASGKVVPNLVCDVTGLGTAFEAAALWRLYALNLFWPSLKVELPEFERYCRWGFEWDTGEMHCLEPVVLGRPWSSGTVSPEHRFIGLVCFAAKGY